MVNGTVEKDIKVEANSDKEIKVIQIDKLEELTHRVASINDYLVDLEDDYYLNKSDVWNELKELKYRVETAENDINRLNNIYLYLYAIIGFTIASCVLSIASLL